MRKKYMRQIIFVIIVKRRLVERMLDLFFIDPNKNYVSILFFGERGYLERRKTYIISIFYIFFINLALKRALIRVYQKKIQ